MLWGKELVFLLVGCSTLIVAGKRSDGDGGHLNVTVLELTGKEHRQTISSPVSHVWTKTLGKDNQDDLYRIRTSLVASQFEGNQPLFIHFSVSNGRDSVVFHLPERISNGSLIYETSRLLLPLHETKKRTDDFQSLVVTVHTRWPDPIDYTLGLQALSEGQYVVRLNESGIWEQHNEKVSLGRPEAHLWKAPVEAQLSIRSEDLVCAVLYLNNKEESLYYSTGEINSNPREGFRAISFRQRLDLNLGAKDLGETLSMYILVQPEDSLCDPSAPPREYNLKKSYSITIRTAGDNSYFWAISLYIVVFLSTPVILVLYILSTLPKGGAQPLPNDVPLIVFDDDAIHRSDVFGHEALPEVDLPERRENELEMAHLHKSATRSVSPPIIRKGGSDWSFGDLHFAFFMVPALLLSLAQYIQSLESKRLEDICYFNYGCSKPWGSLLAFNHLISNFGYIINGLYYIAFVWFRHRNHYRGKGSFNNYGLELSLGAALICQGGGSAMYHVCPSRLSFSFDTPFMQVIAVLAMLKLYGNRHGSVPLHRVNLFIAVVIGANVVISISDYGLVLRLLQGAVQMLSIMFVALKIASGRSDLLKELLSVPVGTVRSGLATMRCRSIVLGVIVLNLLIAVAYALNYGLCESNQVVTVFCIGNMLMYLFYYYVNKMQAKERRNWLSCVTAITSALFWIAAAFFFLNEESNRKLTPAQSRDLNKDCLLMSFYDRHDIWHLLSAQAVLASLISLSTLDDAQSTFPREDLTVF